MYYLLTESFKSNEKKIVEIISQTVSFEKIYMLGSTLATNRTESVFMSDAPSRRNVPHYWLLVLIDKDRGYTDNYVQDKIENNCQHFIPVTVMVFDITTFNKWLTEGQRFACNVIDKAVLLEDATKIPLAIPSSVTIDNERDGSFLSQGTNKIKEFIAGAEFFKMRKQNRMVAFMLHQAAEHGLRTILKTTTGLHINTHNIDKLLRYCCMVNYKITSVFPKENETEERLISILQKSYVETRYKEDFNVTAQDLILLSEKVKALLEITKEYLQGK